MASFSPSPPPQEEPPSIYFHPLSYEEVLRNLGSLERGRLERVTNMLVEVGRGDFWTSHSCIQVLGMPSRKDAFKVQRVFHSALRTPDYFCLHSLIVMTLPAAFNPNSPVSPQLLPTRTSFCVWLRTQVFHRQLSQQALSQISSQSVHQWLM